MLFSYILTALNDSWSCVVIVYSKKSFYLWMHAFVFMRQALIKFPFGSHILNK
jgi:hypothetical protein